MKTIKSLLLGLTIVVAAVMASSCSSSDDTPEYVAPPAPTGK